MADTANLSMGKEPAEADILGDSNMSDKKANTASVESGTSPSPTNVRIRSALPRIWKNAELVILRSKIGLVAGALRDYQDARGLVAAEKIPYTSPSGSKCSAIKIILVAEDLNLVAIMTPDGLDLGVLPLDADTKDESAK